MHAILPLLLLLTPIFAAPHNDVRRSAPLRIPLVAHHKRQYHPDLAVRQDWLKSQGRGIRRKYAKHLGARGQDLLILDRERQSEEMRKRMDKRSTGEVALVSEFC